LIKYADVNGIRAYAIDPDEEIACGNSAALLRQPINGPENADCVAILACQIGG
jgi:hypothetical protein